MSFNPQKGSELKSNNVGRLAVLPQMNTYEAKQKAILMIRRGRMKPRTKLCYVIELLGTAGILPEEDVLSLGHIARRTLRKYRQEGILDTAPVPKMIREELNVNRLWILGPVGTQLAKIQFDIVPTGYLESKIDNISHDVLCNYVYTQVLQAIDSTTYTAILKSRYEVNLTDFRKIQILQPDGMIILQNEETKIPFLIEYHNEDFGSRAAEKVKKYEYVYTDIDWQEQWHLAKFPPILIATTHRAVARGYKKDIEERQIGVGVKCRYLIKSLKSLLEGSQNPLVWLDLAKNKTVNILNL